MTFVVAEHRDGQLNRATWEAIVAAQSLSQPVHVVIVGHGIDQAAGELAGAAVAGVTVIDHDVLASYTADGFVIALASFFAERQPTLVLLPHTYQTRDFAPRLAARLGRTLITDCVAIRAGESGPAFARSVFQGKLAADVVPEGPTPHFVTIQIGAFRADALKRGSQPAEITSATVTIDPAVVRQRPEAPFKEAKQDVDLTAAARIVSVGRGIKSQEHVALAERLAKALGAELSASRPICDNGWLPMDRQIGSSGQTVAPRLYLALGISGAIQHLVGMKGSKTIVAINKDAEAPIFEVADYGIVGDLFEVVPAMITELEKTGGS